MFKGIATEKETTRVRLFSDLGAYQDAYSLTYQLERAREGYTLSVVRKRAADAHESGTTATAFLYVSEEMAMQLLLFVYENAIAPESFHDILEDLVAKTLEKEALV